MPIDVVEVLAPEPSPSTHRPPDLAGSRTRPIPLACSPVSRAADRSSRTGRDPREDVSPDETTVPPSPDTRKPSGVSSVGRDADQSGLRCTSALAGLTSPLIPTHSRAAPVDRTQPGTRAVISLRSTCPGPWCIGESAARTPTACGPPGSRGLDGGVQPDAGQAPLVRYPPRLMPTILRRPLHRVQPAVNHYVAHGDRVELHGCTWSPHVNQDEGDSIT